MPSDEKQAARALVAEAVDQLRDKPLSRFVRVNAWAGGLRRATFARSYGLDLTASCWPRLRTSRTSSRSTSS